MKKTRDIHHFWLFPKQPRIYQFFLSIFYRFFPSSIFVYHFFIIFFTFFSSSIFVYHFLSFFPAALLCIIFSFFPAEFLGLIFFIFSFFYSSIFWYHFFIICSSNLCWNHVLTILWISERITLCMYVCMSVCMSVCM